MWSMRERKKSSVAGQANSTEELPENSPYWKSNWEFGLSAITPKASVYAGSGGSSGATKVRLVADASEKDLLNNRYICHSF
jgi:hypothetical protein